MSDTKKRRDQGRTAWLTQREAALIDAAVEWAEVSASEWCRTVLLAAAEKAQRQRERR